MTITEKIKAIREQKGLSQTAIANAVGFEQAYYNRLENKAGDRVYFDVIIKICDALGVSTHELLSYGEETSHIKEVATLKGENQLLKQELQQVKLENAEKSEAMRRAYMENQLLDDAAQAYARGLLAVELNTMEGMKSKEAADVFNTTVLNSLGSRREYRLIIQEFFHTSDYFKRFIEINKSAIEAQTRSILGIGPIVYDLIYPVYPEEG